MALITSIYKTYLDQVLSLYPIEPFTKAVKLPRADPYNGLNGQYIITPQDVDGVTLFSGVKFEVIGLVVTSTSTSFALSHTTLHWPALPGRVRKFLIQQILPSTDRINCGIIDLGADYSVDGDVYVDFTTNGLLTFNSGVYI